METVVKPIVLALPQTNYVMEGVVNGLIATAIIWLFWTPFLIAIVVPVSSAIIKQFLCKAISKGIAPGKGLFPQSQPLAKEMINNNPQTIDEENQFYYASFITLAIVVIPTSLFIASYIVYMYSLDSMYIITLNIIMFFIISAIEVLFFVLIATEYVPWSIPDTLEYILNYLKTFPKES